MKELEQLKKIYPEFLDKIDFQCESGWYDLIDELCHEIYKICDVKRLDIRACQVKEKFGGLRFYVENASEQVWKLIEAAERKSFKICESCGNEVVKSGSLFLRITTRCVECA